MEGRWERLGVPLLQWFVIPVMVFGIGYFAIGPLISGGAGASRPPARTEPTVKQPPIEPGPRKWTRPSPPQVSITVTPMEEPMTEPIPTGDPIESEPPVDNGDSSGTDEGSVGGMTAPPAKKKEETTGGGTGEATTTGTFKGLGGG